MKGGGDTGYVCTTSRNIWDAEFILSILSELDADGDGIPEASVDLRRSPLASLVDESQVGEEIIEIVYSHIAEQRTIPTHNQICEWLAEIEGHTTYINPADDPRLGEEIPGLIADLDSNNPQIVSRAAQALGYYGSTNEDAAYRTREPLVAALRRITSNSGLRFRHDLTDIPPVLAENIRRTGEVGLNTLMSLAENDSEILTRLRSIEALAGSNDPRVSRLLRQIAQEPIDTNDRNDSSDNEAAFETLLTIDGEADFVINSITDENLSPAVQNAALDGFYEYITSLNEQSEEDIEVAVQLLQQAHPQLMELLQGEDSSSASSNQAYAAQLIGLRCYFSDRHPNSEELLTEFRRRRPRASGELASDFHLAEDALMEVLETIRGEDYLVRSHFLSSAALFDRCIPRRSLTVPHPTLMWGIRVISQPEQPEQSDQ